MRRTGTYPTLPPHLNGLQKPALVDTDGAYAKELREEYRQADRRRRRVANGTKAPALIDERAAFLTSTPQQATSGQ
jgi:hypothetical protein